MADLISFPLIETVVVDYLNGWFPALSGYETVSASDRVPSPRPARFVRVRAVGGAEVDIITSGPSFTVEAYGADAEEASALAEVCRSLLEFAGRSGSMGAAAVRFVRVFALPSNLPDPITDQARYTSTYQAGVRGIVNIT